MKYRKELPVSTIRKKWNQLDQIELAVVCRSDLGPRTKKALRWASRSCVSLMLVWFGFSSYGIDPLGQRVGGIILPLVAASVVFTLVQIYSSTPRYWIDLIVQLLALYEPIDHVAYHRLQQQARNVGYLDPVLVREWIDSERCCIVEIERRLKSNLSPFLNKKI